MVISSVAAQRQRLAQRRTGALKDIGMQLLGQEFVGLALVDHKCNDINANKYKY